MTNKYITVDANVTEGQQNKIKQAMEAATGVTIRLGPNDLAGQDALLLTESQINTIQSND